MSALDGARNSRLSLQSKKRLTDIMYQEAVTACNDKVKVRAGIMCFRS
jgi:hypothetical protein